MSKTINENTSGQDIGPWYKQSWAWFVLTPLIVVVIASMNFMSLAFENKDDVVLDDYYKEGRTINQHFTLDEKAKELKLDGQLDIDLVVGEIVLVLTSQAPLPAELSLELSHPIKSFNDIVLPLKEIAPGRYTAELNQRIANRWYVRLSAPTIMAADGSEQVAAWRLNGEINLETGTRLVFSEKPENDVIGLPPGVEPVEVTAARDAAARD